jgi:hypothetical protein
MATMLGVSLGFVVYLGLPVVLSIDSVSSSTREGHAKAWSS